MKKVWLLFGTVGLASLLIQGVATAAEKMQLKSSIPVKEEEDQEQIVTETFFLGWQSELKPGTLSAEVAPQFAITKNGSKDGNFSQLYMELEAIPFDNWRVNVNWIALQSHDLEDAPEEEGIGDMTVELEYRFLHLLNPIVDARVGLEYTEPLGDVDKGLSDGVREYEPYLSARTRIGNLHLLGEVEYAFRERVVRGGEGDDEEGEERGHELDKTEAEKGHQLDKELFEYGLVAVYPIGRWRPMVELHGETNEFDGGSENEVYVVPEVRYHWEDPLPHLGAIELGLGVPLGVTHDADDLQVRFQVVADIDIFEKEGAKTYGHHNFFKSLFGRSD